jgi:single-strand DNA-binding protein
MNKVIISGNITKDLELRSTSDGKHFVQFGIAINEGTKDKPITNFFNCNAWEHNADFITKYFEKGRKILIEGTLRTSKYKNDEGKEITNTYILVNHSEFCDSKKEAKEENTSEELNDYKAFENPDQVVFEDDDLPF